ncbi:dephospho-CoA kinase [Neobacillus niacini]|uniref:deoxynucleotide monophosphate kinase family protein n=1 Tax=Neobacillus driksii TaxID=3035913 RepID=UPI00278962BD|nr:AAA family ATPase [Neobacillus niacini]MDQ0976662.1 dephospho-CoA kinase [Neobacillus niacini]
MRIAITGKMRSGKNTVADYFLIHKAFRSMAFGEGIKEVIQLYFPELLLQGKPRKLYQAIGQLFREFNPDIWVEILDRRLDQITTWFGDENIDIVVTDLRQENEYKYLKEQGFIIIKVEAEDELRIERIKQSGDTFDHEDFYHETELSVDALGFDYLITNNTTIEDLNEQIKFIINEMEEE